MMIPVAPASMSLWRAHTNSVVVCSPKYESSIVPIVVPVRKDSSTLGTTTVSLCIFTSFLVSAESTARVTVVHFGPRISSTASLASIPLVSLESIAVMMSHFRSDDLLAGDPVRIFMICMPFLCSWITAPIHSKSPESASENSFASFGLKYDVCLSQRDFVRASIIASSRSVGVFLLNP